MSELATGVLRSSAAWTATRVGYATASNANKIRNRLKNGQPGAEFIKYRDAIVYERRTGRKSDGAGFSTKWMQRGKPGCEDAAEHCAAPVAPGGRPRARRLRILDKAQPADKKAVRQT